MPGWLLGGLRARGTEIFIGLMPMLRAEAGMCARRRTYLLLRRQKKVGQEKATPLPVSPIALSGTGGSLRCSVLG